MGEVAVTDAVGMRDVVEALESNTGDDVTRMIIEERGTWWMTCQCASTLNVRTRIEERCKHVCVHGWIKGKMHERACVDQGENT